MAIFTVQICSRRGGGQGGVLKAERGQRAKEEAEIVDGAQKNKSIVFVGGCGGRRTCAVWCAAVGVCVCVCGNAGVSRHAPTTTAPNTSSR